VGELGIEGRATLPFETGSRVAAMFGMPVALHFGASVRLDTGLYLPVTLYDPVLFAVSVPLDIWFQVTPRLWLGPMTGLRFYHQGPADRTDLALGFGLGYSLARALDLKTMFLMRHQSNRGRT